MSKFIDQAEQIITAREEFQRRNQTEITAWVNAERSRLGLDGMTLPHVPPEVLAQIKKNVSIEVFAKTEFESLERVPRLQIRAPAGLGKTRISFAELAKKPFWNDRTIDYYVPTSKLAQEQEANIAALGLPVRVFHGREAKDMCSKPKAAKRTAALGLNVFSTLCKRKGPNGKEITCPDYAHCPYIAQWQDCGPEVRIFVHAYLGLPRPRPDGKGLSPPDLIIVDELAIQSLIKDLSFGVDRLDGPAQQAVQEHLDLGTDLRLAMRKHGLTTVSAQRRAEELRAGIETSVSPAMNDAETLSKLEEFIGLEKTQLAQFYDRVAVEIDLDRPFHGIEVRANERIKVDGNFELADRVHLYWSIEPQFGKQVPLLIIDADADIEINRRFFGDDLSEVEIRAARNANVIQCCSSRLSKYKLLGPDPKKHPRETEALRKVLRIIHEKVDRGRRLLVVMPKQVRKFLCAHNNGEVQSARYNPPRSEVWNGATVTHFGAIRGSDEWKDCDTVIIVGREQPNPQTFEEQARAIWVDDPEPLQFIAGSKYPQRPLGYRMRDGSHWGVMTPFHPDPRVQRLLEFVREREMVQAIDRLRLIHAPEPKSVIILCNIPLDITVDELRTFDQIAGTPGRLGSRARLEAAMQCTGIVPLGARDLHHVFADNRLNAAQSNADLFSSVSAAKTVLKEAKRAIGDSAANNRGGNQIYNLF